MDSSRAEVSAVAGQARRRRFRAQGFQLDENPSALAAVIFFLLLAVYAFVDGFITPDEGYVSTPPYWLFVVVGIACTVGVYSFIMRAQVPRTESRGVAALVGIAAAIALYPGFLRISQAAGSGKYGVQTYTLSADFTLRPNNAGLPSFRAPLDSQYWREHMAGDQWQLKVRHGLLGIWCYQIAPLRKEIEDYNVRKAMLESIMQSSKPKH